MSNPLEIPPPSATPPSRTLRVVTLNLWGENGPYEARLALCAEELLALAPDAVMLQEVRQVPGKVANTAETLARALDMHHVFQKTVEWGGGDEGLAILSRFPIGDSGHTPLPHPMPEDQRILLWAIVDSGAGRVALFTTHLTYRMTHGDKREDQAFAVDETVQAVLGAQSERPAVTVLTGDFNAAPDADEIRFLRGLHSLRGKRTYYQDAFLVQPQRPSLVIGQGGPAEPGVTWARRNVYTHKLRFLESDRRIDYIFVGPASRDGRGLVHDCRVVLDEASMDGVFPSDHFGVYAEVQLTPLI
jgi:endonuclease/exonuclease/phosphatase family metal-dependent hydrolase